MARPYAPLRVEFERRLAALQQARDSPDPRGAQITRLKAEATRPAGTVANAGRMADPLTATARRSRIRPT
jgi:hypothetical protein